jgi:hypothetical protein
MVQSLISQNPDIQKILAFEGGFEKLLNIVTQEGGVEGGIVAQESLTCVDGLLRFNASNQVPLVFHPFIRINCFTVSVELFSRIDTAVRNMLSPTFPVQFADKRSPPANIRVTILGSAETYECAFGYQYYGHAHRLESK